MISAPVFTEDLWPKATADKSAPSEGVVLYAITDEEIGKVEKIEIQTWPEFQIKSKSL